MTPGSAKATASGAETEVDRADGEAPYRGTWWRFLPLRNAALSGILLAVGFALGLLGTSEVVVVPLYILAAGFGASHWGREALEALTRPRINIDVLMAVAATGAAALGLWAEAAFLAFLYGAAEALEEYVYDRTRGAIRALLDLAPAEAMLLRDGTEVRVAAQELLPGDRFLVRPGERIATDGVIERGETSLDEAPVTGESVPVEKGEGATVFAGTVNLTGAITVNATHSFEDNTLARIIHLVEEAQEEKTAAQRYIDRFGDRYSPAIVLGALVLLIVPPVLGGDFREWAVRAVTLTVAGAPCALVMSTPVAVATAIGSAGKRGVLIKGGAHLEELARVRVVAFDKTGTLTRGVPEVTDVSPLNGASTESLLRLAAAVDRYSEHPLARSIVRRAEADGVAIPDAGAFRAVTGAGAKAEVDGTDVYVGNTALFVGLGAPLGTAGPIADRYREQGKTAVLVGTADQITGVLGLRDEPRLGAREAIEALRAAGVERVVMLTGDHELTARAIAGTLDIDEVRAELRPGQKSEAIRELEARWGPVAMIGDGINDAPALATATVGIAMGTAGTDAAIEAADVALMGEELTGVVYAVRLGRRARRISLQNIIFSVLLLTVLVPAAVVGLLTVAVAVTSHEVAEIIAVLNGLRARSVRDARTNATRMLVGTDPTGTPSRSEPRAN
ncbi:MAG: heavy metal translocating P-type ATPase [Gemmatimonadaceae bacterium]